MLPCSARSGGKVPPTTFVLLSLFVAGCGSREGDTDPEGLPDDTDDGSCTSDDACAVGGEGYFYRLGLFATSSPL
jgi:hypothetical protein